MEGYEDKSFKPDKYVTREEVAKILYLLKNDVKAQTNLNFNDVDEKIWSYKYINTLANNGILKGYEDGSFKPKNGITRAEIAVILERMYN